MTCPDGDLPREVAGVLYFAAILSARPRLGERISEVPDDRLRQACRWALHRAWLESHVAELFRRGLAALAADAGEAGA